MVSHENEGIHVAVRGDRLFNRWKEGEVDKKDECELR